MAQNDGIQHGIDDNPRDDPQKGATLGGLGGAAVGAAAGSLVGPVGTIVGAVVGGLSGAVGSGAAVAAIDKIDNDNTVSGVGTGATPKVAALGATDAGTNAGRSWDEVSPHYRQGWEQHYGQSGAKWEDTEPAHQYAWEKRSQPDYQNRDWATAETDLQRDWATQHPDKPWASAAASVREGWDSTGEVLRLHEEQLQANKQRVQTGEVTLRKDVITETKTLDVPVTREEVYIERRPVQAGEIAAGEIGAGQEIRVPVMAEQVTVEKNSVVTEEVGIGKREVQETQHVSDTVRREEARIERQGNPKVHE